MTNPLPAPYDGQNHPPTGQQIQAMIAASKNVTALVKSVADAYRLTITLKRDIAQIEGHYTHLEQKDRQIHEEIVLALEGRFLERAAQIDFVERIASQLIEKGEYEIAHSIISQLMKILQQSPTREAFANRRA